MAKKAKKQKKPNRRLLASPIGILHSGTNGNSDGQIDALKDAIKLSTAKGTGNPKYANDKHDKLDDHAKDLGNDSGTTWIVAAGGTRSALAALKWGNGKPVIVTSVSSPNALPITKVAGCCARTTELDPVRLGLLRELRPGAMTFGALFNPSRPDVNLQKTALDNKALALGINKLNYQPVDPNDATSVDTQIDTAFQKFGTATVQGAIVTADPVFNNHRKTILDAAAARGIPTIYQWREFAEKGLISYGPNLTVAYKIAGYFAGLIAEGPDTVETLPLLPLESFELVINLKVAKDLGIKVPPTLLARATDIILK